MRTHLELFSLVLPPFAPADCPTKALFQEVAKRMRTHNLLIHRIRSGPCCLHCDLHTHTGGQDSQTSTT